MAPADSDHETIEIIGGLIDDDPPRHALVGSICLDREEGETAAEFRERVAVVARAKQAAHVVIGGLPE